MRWQRFKDALEQRKTAVGSSAPATGRSLRRLVKAHATRLLAPVFSKPFDGEVFLAGGAFKPLIKAGIEVRDLDLWVRNRRVRERLCEHLVDCGAQLVRDFHPYCLQFRSGEAEIEITYQNVKDRPISAILEGFDLAPCGIAATYCRGRVTHPVITPAAERSLRDRIVFFNDGYMERLATERTPDVLQGLDRIARFAEEMGMEVPDEVCEELWGLYENVFTREERESCVETYLRATVEYKGRCDLEVLRRAESADSESGLKF